MVIVVGVVVVAAIGVIWVWSLGGNDRVEQLAAAPLWSQVEGVLDGPILEERRDPVRGVAALLPLSRTDATLLRWYSSPVDAAETTRRLMDATGMQHRSDADVFDERDEREWYDFGGYVDHDGGRWYVVIDVYLATGERLQTRNSPPVPPGGATLVSVHLSEEP